MKNPAFRSGVTAWHYESQSHFATGIHLEQGTLGRNVAAWTGG